MWSYSTKSDASGESNANRNVERKPSGYGLHIVVLRRQHRLLQICLHSRYLGRIYSPTTHLLGGALACGSRFYDLGRSAYYHTMGRIGQRQRFHKPMLRARQFQRLWKLRDEGIDSDGTSAFLAAPYIPRSKSTSPKLARFSKVCLSRSFLLK